MLLVHHLPSFSMPYLPVLSKPAVAMPLIDCESAGIWTMEWMVLCRYLSRSGAVATDWTSLPSSVIKKEKKVRTRGNGVSANRSSPFQVPQSGETGKGPSSSWRRIYLPLTISTPALESAEWYRYRTPSFSLGGSFWNVLERTSGLSSCSRCPSRRVVTLERLPRSGS